MNIAIITFLRNFICDTFCSAILGVDAQLNDIRSGKESYLVAQVLRNWCTLPYAFDITPRTFLTTHESFAPANIVLRPNVQLLSYEEDVVKFIELDESVDPLNVRKNPILLVTQTVHTKRILLLQRKVYDEMMKSFDVDDHDVIWMFHTARCGSTLWSQIFYRLQNWTVFSESQTMFYSVVYARKVNDYMAFSKTKEYEELVVAYIKSYLRLVPKGNSVFWRAHAGLTEHMIPIIHKRFPKHKILFSYRDPLPTAKSAHKMLATIPIWQQRLKQVQADIENQHPTGFSREMRLFWTTGYDMRVCREAINKSGIRPIVFEWFFLTWAARITVIKTHQAAGIPIGCVKYENLVEDPNRTIRCVFEYAGIPQDLVNVGLKAMEMDSQAGLPFSRKERKNHQGWTSTEDAVSRCNKLLRFFNLPVLTAEFVMPNTL